MSRYLRLFLSPYCPLWKSVTPHGLKCKGRQVSLHLRSRVPVSSWGTAAPLYSSLPLAIGLLPREVVAGLQHTGPWAGMGWDWGERFWGPSGRSWICPFPEVTTRKRVGLSNRISPALWKAEVRNLEIGGHFWENQYIIIERKIGGSLQSVGSLWVPRMKREPPLRPQVLAGPETSKQMQTSSADPSLSQIRKCFWINIINNPRSTQGAALGFRNPILK